MDNNFPPAQDNNYPPVPGPPNQNDPVNHPASKQNDGTLYVHHDPSSVNNSQPNNAYNVPYPDAYAAPTPPPPPEPEAPVIPVNTPSPDTAKLSKQVKEIQEGYHNLTSTENYNRPPAFDRRPMFSRLETPDLTQHYQSPAIVQQSFPVDQNGQVYMSPEQQKMLREKPPKTKSPKKWLVLGVLLVVVMAGAGGYLWLSSNKPSTKTVSITNGGYNYSFIFYGDSKTVVVNGHNEAEGHATSPFNVSALPSSYQQTCKQQYPSLIAVSSYTIQGQQYPVCTNQTQESILSSFKYNGQWQLFTIYSPTDNQPVSLSFAQSVLNSLKISQQ